MTGPTSSDNLEELKRLKDELTRFLMMYKFAIDEVTTKVNILREEFTHLHDYNPIEHVALALKTPASIVEKARTQAYELDFDVIRDEIQDIAGVRVTCSFVSDVLHDLRHVQRPSRRQRDRGQGLHRELRSRTATRACTRSSRFRCSCPAGRRTCPSRCSSARSPWTSGRVSNTRSTTSTTGQFPAPSSTNSRGRRGCLRLDAQDGAPPRRGPRPRPPRPPPGPRPTGTPGLRHSPTAS